MLSPEAHNELAEALPLIEKEPKRSSLFVTYALPLAAMLAIFGALGFGLMMINKEAVEVDQLNGKYKSMQYARESFQTAASKMGGDSDVVNELVYDYDGLELDSDNVYLEYPDDPKFRLNSQRTDALENNFDNADADERSSAEQYEVVDYPDNPEFRASFV